MEADPSPDLFFPASELFPFSWMLDCEQDTGQPSKKQRGWTLRKGKAIVSAAAPCPDSHISTNVCHHHGKAGGVYANASAKKMYMGKKWDQSSLLRLFFFNKQQKW